MASTSDDLPNDQPQLPLRGYCYCKSSAFTIASLPIRSYLCHCHDCRHATGSVLAATALFDSATLSWTSNELVKTYGSDEEGNLKFCGRCGSRLTMSSPSKWGSPTEPNPGEIMVAMGSIEGAETWWKPTVAFFGKRKEEWMGVAQHVEVRHELAK